MSTALGAKPLMTVLSKLASSALMAVRPKVTNWAWLRLEAVALLLSAAASRALKASVTPCTSAVVLVLAVGSCATKVFRWASSALVTPVTSASR